MDKKANDMEKRPAPSFQRQGIAIGITLGLIFGSLFDQIAVGLVLGIAVGTGMGRTLALQAHKEKKGQKRNGYIAGG